MRLGQYRTEDPGRHDFFVPSRLALSVGPPRGLDPAVQRLVVLVVAAAVLHYVVLTLFPWAPPALWSQLRRPFTVQFLPSRVPVPAVPGTVRPPPRPASPAVLPSPPPDSVQEPPPRGQRTLAPRPVLRPAPGSSTDTPTVRPKAPSQGIPATTVTPVSPLPGRPDGASSRSTVPGTGISPGGGIGASRVIPDAGSPGLQDRAPSSSDLLEKARSLARRLGHEDSAMGGSAPARLRAATPEALLRERLSMDGVASEVVMADGDHRVTTVSGDVYCWKPLAPAARTPFNESYGFMISTCK